MSTMNGHNRYYEWRNEWTNEHYLRVDRLVVQMDKRVLRVDKWVPASTASGQASSYYE